MVLKQIFVPTWFGRMAEARDQPKIVKRKSKKENGKALVEPEPTLPSGKKSKRVHRIKDQMVVDDLAKAVEFSIKVSHTPS
jgi:hypothetical protein